MATVPPSTALVPWVPRDLAEMQAAAKDLAMSGYFADARGPAQALVKILAGRELGIPAVAAMTGIYMVEGRLMIGAHLLAAMIKRSQRYNFRIVEGTTERCELAFTEVGPDGKWIPSGPNIEVTLAEAVRLGWTVSGNGKAKANWTKHPDDMLFARGLTKGYRRYCPDLTLGTGPLYTPDELDRDDDDPTRPAAVVAPFPTTGPNGEPITVPVETPAPPAPEAAPATPPPAADAGEVVDAEFTVVPDAQAAADQVQADRPTETPATPPATPQAPPRPAKVTEEEVQAIQTLIRETGTDAKLLCKHYGVSTVRQLTREKYLDALEKLNQKKSPMTR